MLLVLVLGGLGGLETRLRVGMGRHRLFLQDIVVVWLRCAVGGGGGVSLLVSMLEVRVVPVGMLRLL